MTVKEAKEKFQEALQLLEDVREEFDISIFDDDENFGEVFDQKLQQAMILIEDCNSDLEINDD
jgi:hypothetical protein